MHLYQSILALIGVLGLFASIPQIAASIFKQGSDSSDAEIKFFAISCVLIAQKFLI